MWVVQRLQLADYKKEEINNVETRVCSFLSPFFIYRDGVGDGSFYSKANFLANMCSTITLMRPRRGSKVPFLSMTANREDLLIFIGEIYIFLDAMKIFVVSLSDFASVDFVKRIVCIRNR